APAIIMILNEIAKLGGYGFPANSMAIVLCANMFVFYFGVLADLTPPVALAAFAGAAIAKADPMKTGVQATKLAIAAFIIPYIFVYNPQMLLFGVNEHPFEAVWMVITAIIGIVGLAAGVEGYLLTRIPWTERIMAIAGGLLLVIPGMVTDLIGAAILTVLVLMQIAASRKEKSGGKAAA
ncbi:MAG: TRAP transporter large permease subunit, partial [Spirochaetota bacterium]